MRTPSSLHFIVFGSRTPDDTTFLKLTFQVFSRTKLRKIWWKPVFVFQLKKNIRNTNTALARSNSLPPTREVIFILKFLFLIPMSVLYSFPTSVYTYVGVCSYRVTFYIHRIILHASIYNCFFPPMCCWKVFIVTSVYYFILWMVPKLIEPFLLLTVTLIFFCYKQYSGIFLHIVSVHLLPSIYLDVEFLKKTGWDTSKANPSK